MNDFLAELDLAGSEHSATISQVSYNSQRSRGSRVSHGSRRQKRKKRKQSKRIKAREHEHHQHHRKISLSKTLQEMPAGRPYNEQDQLLTLNKEANKELNNIRIQNSSFFWNNTQEML